MQRFVEHRKQTILEAIQELDAKQGFESHFDILRLDLLDALRLPEVVCEHEDVFVEAELRSLIQQDYDALREFTENVVYNYKSHAYRSLLEEIIPLLEAEAPVDVFVNGLNDLIDTGIKNIQNDFKDILQGRADGLEDAEAERSAAPAEAPPEGDEGIEYVDEPEGETPEGEAPAAPSGRRAASERDAIAGGMARRPHSKGEYGIDTRPHRRGDPIGGTPDPVSAYKTNQAPTAWSPPGGWMGGAGRVGSGIYKGIKNKIKGAGKKIGDWWMDRPSTEGVDELQQLFTESGVELMKRIQQFGDQLKKFIFQHKDSLAQDASALADVSPEGEALPQAAGLARVGDEDTGATGAEDAAERGIAPPPKTPAEAEKEREALPPEQQQQAELNALQSADVIAKLIGGEWWGATKAGKAKQAEDGFRLTDDKLRRGPGKGAVVTDNFVVKGKPLKTKDVVDRLAKKFLGHKNRVGEFAKHFGLGVGKRGTPKWGESDKIIQGLATIADPIVQKYDMKDPRQNSRAVLDLKDAISDVLGGAPATTTTAAAETPEEKGARLGATLDQGEPTTPLPTGKARIGTPDEPMSDEEKNRGLALAGIKRPEDAGPEDAGDTGLSVPSEINADSMRSTYGDKFTLEFMKMQMMMNGLPFNIGSIEEGEEQFNQIASDNDLSSEVGEFWNDWAASKGIKGSPKSPPTLDPEEAGATGEEAGATGEEAGATGEEAGATGEEAGDLPPPPRIGQDRPSMNPKEKIEGEEGSDAITGTYINVLSGLNDPKEIIKVLLDGDEKDADAPAMLTSLIRGKYKDWKTNIEQNTDLSNVLAGVEDEFGVHDFTKEVDTKAVELEDKLEVDPTAELGALGDQLNTAFSSDDQKKTG